MLIKENYEDELDALKKESEIPMEDLLETLPHNMLKRITGEAHSDDDDDEESEEESGDESATDDEQEGVDSDDNETETVDEGR